MLGSTALPLLTTGLSELQLIVVGVAGGIVAALILGLALMVAKTHSD